MRHYQSTLGISLSKDELDKCIKSFTNGKATGLDDIPIESLEDGSTDRSTTWNMQQDIPWRQAKDMGQKRTSTTSKER